MREKLLKLADECNATWQELFNEFGSRADAPEDVQEVKQLLSDLAYNSALLAVHRWPKARPTGHHPAPHADKE